MAQIPIREYDAKKMYFDSIGKKYNGIQIQINNFEKQIQEKLGDKKYVVKPDMLFGKRGKMGLLGIGLEKQEIINWIKEKTKTQIEINKVKGDLTHFLVEDFIKHNDEFYISFSANRDYDLINFSFSGGIEIEENWDSVIEIKIPTLKNLDKKIIEEKIFNSKLNSIKDKKLQNKIEETILNLWNYYKNYGFVYLEVNPFCFDEKNGDLILLDMVAKIDDSEFFKQKQNWKNLEFPDNFGFQESSEEKYIKELDKQTGASLKFKILNKNAKIWTLLAGGGGSLVITDSLGAMGFAEQIGNYGELSGNPTREFTREYTRKLIEVMLENKIKGKYLIIAGAIANFTKIDTTFAGIIDIFKEKAEEIKAQKIKILVRRGGINEKKGLKIMKENCEKLGIPCEIADSGEYMTDILKKIKI